MEAPEGSVPLILADDQITNVELLASSTNLIHPYQHHGRVREDVCLMSKPGNALPRSVSCVYSTHALMIQPA